VDSLCFLFDCHYITYLQSVVNFDEDALAEVTRTKRNC